MTDPNPNPGRRRLPDLYSIDEIAAAFGLSRDTIKRRIRSGEFGRVIQFGDGRVRVRFSAIEQFLASHERTGPANNRQIENLTAARAALQHAE